MSILIAIPQPTNGDEAYNERSLPPYLSALEAAGARPVVIPLNKTQEEIAGMLRNVHGVLLPGSRFDVDPERYGETRSPECGPADPVRASVDELLLQDAFNLQKPILAICHGMQTLNVWRSGSLIQDLKTEVNHRPGREVIEAHPVQVQVNSRLRELLKATGSRDIQVNSSHHQAIKVPGDGLVVSAISPVDGVIEAVEGEVEGHFVLGVQWHPERTYAQSEFSRAIFSRFIAAAKEYSSRLAGETGESQ
jgi:putative glutamine amidotransferase